MGILAHLMPAPSASRSLLTALRVCTAALLCAATRLAAAPLPPPAPLTLTPCVIEHPLRLTVAAADCGTLVVPEDPQRPQGRQLRLHVARVAAISRRRAADALFVLAGGPGQAA